MRRRRDDDREAKEGQGLEDARAFYKAQREALLRRYGVRGVREFGGRGHARGHGERGSGRDGVIPWEPVSR